MAADPSRRHLGPAALSICLFVTAFLLTLTGGFGVPSPHAADYAPPQVTAWQRSQEGRLTIKWAETARVQQKRRGDRLILRFTQPFGVEMMSSLRHLSNFVDLDRTTVDSMDLSLALRPGTASKVDVREAGLVTVEFFRDPEAVPRSRITVSAIERGVRLTLDWPGPTKVTKNRSINELRLEAYPAWDIDSGQLADLARGLQPWLDGLSADKGAEATDLSLILAPQITPSVRAEGVTRTVIDLIRDASALPAPAAGPKRHVFIPAKKPGISETAFDSASVARPPIPKRRPNQPAGLADTSDKATASTDPGSTPPEALIFDWSEPVAAAFFIRAGHLWAVFDDPEASHLAALPAPPIAFGPGSPVKAKGGTALRYPLQQPVAIGVGRTDDGSWRIEPLPSALPPRPLTIERVDGSAALLVTPTSGGQVVSVVDPAVGDRIDILPIRDPGLGQPESRRFVDLELLPTAQGLVWRPLNDQLIASLESGGLEFRSPGGLSLSQRPPDGPNASEPEIVKAIAAKDPGSQPPSPLPAKRPESKPEPGIELAKDDPTSVRMPPQPSSYFDLAGAGVERPLVGEYRRIRRQAITKSAPEERDQARLDLARLLVSERLATEARTVLQAISDEAENDVVLQKRALSGVSAFLIGHLAEASTLLLDPDLSADEEIDVWRAALESTADTWQSAAEHWRNSNDVLDAYPPRLKLDLGLMALQAAIETDDDKMIQRGLRRLTSLALDPYDEARVDAMRALRAERAGDAERAHQLLSGLTSSPNPAVRTLAKFQLATMGLEADPHQRETLETLEDSIPLWRGHPQERAMLDTLARRYRDANALREALTTWRRLIQLYPDAAKNDDLNMARQDTFLQALANGTKPALDLLDVYAIYLDFINLLPDDPESREVHRHLAQHLTDLDLLDEAIDVLRPLMTSAVDAIERAELALEIATLMLRQGRATPALAVLDEARWQDADLPPVLDEQHRLIRARALARLGRADDALRELRDVQSPPFRQLRARILWDERRWQRLAAVVESYLADADLASPLTEDDQELVLWLALARLNDGTVAQLNALRVRFGDAMQDGLHAGAFHVATQSAARTSDIENLLAATANQLTELRRFREATLDLP